MNGTLLCPPNSIVSNGTCVCLPGYNPPGVCFFDSFFSSTPEYATFIFFMVIAFTALLVVSLYEVCYAIFKKEAWLQMFYPSRIVTFFQGAGLNSVFEDVL